MTLYFKSIYTAYAILTERSVVHYDNAAKWQGNRATDSMAHRKDGLQQSMHVQNPTFCLKFTYSRYLAPLRPSIILILAYPLIFSSSVIAPPSYFLFSDKYFLVCTFFSSTAAKNCFLPNSTIL